MEWQEIFDRVTQFSDSLTYTAFSGIHVTEDSQLKNIMEKASGNILKAGCRKELSNGYVRIGYIIRKWKLYKQHFRLHAVFARELFRTEDTGVHIELLHQLPFRCFYLTGLEEVPNPYKITGAFVCFEKHPTNENGLVFHALYLRKDFSTNFQTFEVIDGETILQSWKRHSANSTATEYVLGIGGSDEDGTDATNTETDKVLSHLWASFIFNAAYYMASKNNDAYKATPGRRLEYKGKGKVQSWEIGYREGSKFEDMYRVQHPNSNSTSERIGGHNSPRAHIRRAHWHHYWTGAGRTVLEVRWIPPIYVNTTGEEFPTVSHDIKGERQEK